MLQGKGAREAGQLRALQHLTRQRRGWELAKFAAA